MAIKQENPLAEKEVKKSVRSVKKPVLSKKVKVEQEEVEYKSLMDQFVFMDKAKKILEVGLVTGKNVILYGPGGHGKSELSLEFFYEKGINPYIFTMGNGTTTDRLFGGIDIPMLQDCGKLDYLIENSFMNHEFVIFEELMDAQPHILEQLKDILSSKEFRNGTQRFRIKTKFIVCCTNKSREEFTKTPSLRALMERFPLEQNVVWDNYNEASYNKLLEKRFGEGTIDPTIPYLLQEYHKNSITISPRTAIDAYEVYTECGPDSLPFIAEFAKKPKLIASALTKFTSTLEFKKICLEIEDSITVLKNSDLRSKSSKVSFVSNYEILVNKLKELKKLKVDDDVTSLHTQVVRASNNSLDEYSTNYQATKDKLALV